MTFVQLAIAFEALYGGTEEDPIEKTISNRIAYSVGRSTGEREQLRTDFAEFYRTRSKVVRRGATRLNYEQYQQFLMGQEVLTRCLKRELELLPRREEE
jgi:Apea-like HEPN